MRCLPALSYGPRRAERVHGSYWCLILSNTCSIVMTCRTGVPRFVYVSTVENNLPDVLLKGYFNGKRRAEQAVLTM